MKNFKIITLVPLITIIIIHQNTNLSDFTVGVSYGIAIGLLILGLIPKEKFKQFKLY